MSLRLSLSLRAARAIAKAISGDIVLPNPGGGGSPAPVLQTLTSSVSSATVGAALNATISGKTAGSVLSLTGAGAAGVTASGNTVSGTPTTVGDINVVETLAGATGSPKTTSALISVAGAAATVPAAMAAPTLTAGDGQITVARAAAPNDGGSPITSYDARRSTDGTTWTTTTGLSASQVITGLTNGTAYQIQTRAVNAVGVGAWSPSATATPAAVAARLGISSRAVWLGNSVDAFNFARSYRQWSLAYAGGRFIQPIGGVLSNGGDTMVDMAQRIPAMQADAPQLVMLGSATNDLSESGITFAVLKTRLRTLVDAVLATGAKCVVQLTKTSTSLVGAKETLRQQLNADTQSTYAGMANVVVANFTGTVSPGTDSSVTYDGTHFNAKGSQLAGLAVAAQLRDLITTDPLIPVSGAMAGNINTAFDMAGTGGTISGGTGSVPTGYIVANASGATMVSEIVTNAIIDGRTVARALRLRFSGSATDASGDVTVKRTQSSVPYSPGSSYSTSQLVKFGKADANGAPTGDPVGLAFFGINTGTTSSLMSKSLDTSVQGIPYGFDGTMRTHPMSSQGVGTQLAWEAGWRFPVGTVDFVIDIALVNFTKEETVPYAVPFYQSVRRNRPSDGLAYGVYSQAAITGTAAVGNVLTCGVGTFSGGGDPDKTVANGGMVYAYQWAKDGVAISGATSRTFTTQASGLHTCDVTATNSFGSVTITVPGVAVP